MMGEIPFNVVCHEGSYMTPNHADMGNGIVTGLVVEQDKEDRDIVAGGIVVAEKWVQTTLL